MEDSIFTKIIKGEVPCHKIYEDDYTIAFLDIHPIQPGHTLVVPKVQIDHIDDLSDEYYHAVWSTVKLIAKAHKNAFGMDRVGLKVEGIDVPHAHVHVFPFTTSQQFRNNPDMTAEPNHTELTEIAEKIKESLNA